jgi:hypothetical protein
LDFKGKIIMFKKWGSAAQKAALEKAQKASAEARKGLGRIEARGGLASRLIKRAGYSQMTSGAGKRSSGRRKKANLNYNRNVKGTNLGPKGRGKAGASIKRAKSMTPAKGVNIKTYQRLLKKRLGFK